MENLDFNNLTEEQISILRSEAVKSLGTVIDANNSKMELRKKSYNIAMKSREIESEPKGRKYYVNPSTVSKVSFSLKMVLKVVAMKLFKIPYEALPTPTYNPPEKEKDFSRYGEDAQEAWASYNRALDAGVAAYNREYDKGMKTVSQLKNARSNIMSDNQCLLQYYNCCIDGFNDIYSNKYQRENFLTNLAACCNVSCEYWKDIVGNEEIQIMINNSVNSLNNILKKENNSLRRR